MSAETPLTSAQQSGGTNISSAEITAHDIVGRDQIITNVNITGDMLYERLAQAPVARHVRVEEFRTLVNERTREFVGREFIFKAIDDLLHNPDFPSGYIVIRGEPGIGKTALISQLVKLRGYVHHFNISTQNIRSARDFLSSICAQLIVRYGLEHTRLPEEAAKDSGFLSRLLAEATARPAGRPVVILVDALDEAENLGLPSGENCLYLPQALGDGVFFIVTTREVDDQQLFVDRRQDLYLRDDDPQNCEDVRLYIRHCLQVHGPRMAPQLRAWGVTDEEFVEVLTDKSLGNFMYLVYVLRAIRDGRLTLANTGDIRQLPQGLRDYYQRHWRSMKGRDRERFVQTYEPVVCILATVREPVSAAQVAEWTQLAAPRVREVIQEWREFLNESTSPTGVSLYRVYHTSFQDFLQSEVGLAQYHNTIAEAALKKIRW